MYTEISRGSVLNYTKIDYHWNMSSGFTGCTKDSMGIIAYSVKGRFHREGGPAVIYPDGIKRWYQHGELHRLDGPAIEHEGREYRTAYYLNGQFVTVEEHTLRTAWTKTTLGKLILKKTKVI
jgi:hypothetical protein